VGLLLGSSILVGIGDCIGGRSWSDSESMRTRLSMQGEGTHLGHVPVFQKRRERIHLAHIERPRLLLEPLCQHIPQLAVGPERGFRPPGDDGTEVGSCCGLDRELVPWYGMCKIGGGLCWELTLPGADMVGCC
jgi:hypothetical protein